MVAAATGAGLGNFSDMTQSRTYGDVPVAMVILEELNVSCPAGLLVSWADLDRRELYGPDEEIYLIFNFTNEASGMTGNRTVKYDGSTVSQSVSV